MHCKTFMFRSAAATFALLLFVHSGPAAQRAPVPVIFDTDLAEDVDDVGALALLHALADRGEARILATMVSARNPHVVPCLDALNTHYGRPDLPIGYVRDFQIGYVKTERRDITSKYAAEIARRFAHDLETADAPDAAKLYRKILAGEPDRSVTIVTVGFLTNLKNLLDSPPDEHSPLDGEALVRRKVRLWVAMGGKFPEGRHADGSGEYNFYVDTAASVRTVNDWPTPAVFSGWEIGERVMTGARLRKLPEDSPTRAAYLFYNGLRDRQSWDQAAVLYAVRGAGAYWRLSEPGVCLMHARVPAGYNEWVPTPRGRHRYLVEKMPPARLARVIEDLMLAGPRSEGYPRGNRVDREEQASPDGVATLPASYLIGRERQPRQRF